MARIRSVHPPLWTDAAFVSVQPLARLLAIGLWGEADDAGIFQWNPLQLKMRLLPGDNCDVTVLLAELTAAKIVRTFAVGGVSYGAVRNFAKFQRPQKPMQRHPLPEEFVNYIGAKPGQYVINTITVPYQSATATGNGPQIEGKEEGRKEGKGGEGGNGAEAPPSPVVAGKKERKKREPKPVTTIDSYQEVGEKEIAFGRHCGLTDAEIGEEIEKFTRHYEAKGERRADWPRSLREWFSRAPGFRNGNGRAKHA